jgi:hypothetical protein
MGQKIETTNGTLVRLAPETREIIVTTRAGKNAAIPVAKSTKVVRDGVAATIDDLEEGDDVTAVREAGMPAGRLVVVSKAKIESRLMEIQKRKTAKTKPKPSVTDSKPTGKAVDPVQEAKSKELERLGIFPAFLGPDFKYDEFEHMGSWSTGSISIVTDEGEIHMDAIVPFGRMEGSSRFIFWTFTRHGDGQRFGHSVHRMVFALPAVAQKKRMP